MEFGNPYGDPWNEEIVEYWLERVKKMGVRLISLSDHGRHSRFGKYKTDFFASSSEISGN